MSSPMKISVDSRWGEPFATPSLPAAVVVARLSSSRLPGKVLRPVDGRPLLGYTLERLHHCPDVGDIVVATSVESSDDPLAEFCAEAGISCYRGSLNDVAGRFVEAAQSVGASWAFRANGDSPLLGVDLFARAWEACVADSGLDLVTNVFPRQLPPGASVELIRVAALAGARHGMDDADREHVTLHLYRHWERFRIRQIDCSDLLFSDGLRLVVDDSEDLDRMVRLVDRLDCPIWRYSTQELLDLVATVQ